MVVSNSMLKIAKGELRTLMAMGVLLLIFVGFSLATGGDVLYKFDFGDGQGIASGYIAVNGNASTYPQSSDDIKFGWLGGVIAKSSGAAVSDLRLRDSNTGVGGAEFKISDIANGNYAINLMSGDLSDNFSTRLSVAGHSYIISSQIGEWETFTFNTTVENNELILSFERSGANLWGVNSITLTPITTPADSPIFDIGVKPEEHTIKRGGTVVYKISVTPLNGYANVINLSLTGLTEGMTAQFIPVSAQPPFVADLVISTSDSMAATRYNLVINAKGTDPDAHSVNSKIVLIVTDTQHTPMSGVDDFSDSGMSQIDEAHTQPYTMSEAKEIQKLIDEFVRKVQNKQLATPLELDAIEDIAQINALPVLMEFPVPQTTFGATLLYLTRTGMIESVVDGAPPGEDMVAPPSPPGFFEKLLSVFSNPVK